MVSAWMFSYAEKKCLNYLSYKEIRLISNKNNMRISSVQVNKFNKENLTYRIKEKVPRKFISFLPLFLFKSYENNKII